MEKFYVVNKTDEGTYIGSYYIDLAFSVVCDEAVSYWQVVVNYNEEDDSERAIAEIDNAYAIERFINKYMKDNGIVYINGAIRGVNEVSCDDKSYEFVIVKDILKEKFTGTWELQ